MDMVVILVEETMQKSELLVCALLQFFSCIWLNYLYIHVLSYD